MGLSRPRVSVIKRRGKFSLMGLSFFALIFASAGGYIIWRSLAIVPPAGDHVANELLVHFNDNVSQGNQDLDLKRQNASIIGEISDIKVKRIRVPRASLEHIKNALSDNSDVDFVEYNSILQAQEQLPNDPYFSPSSAWNLDGGAWGWSITHTNQAWDITEGNPSIKIAILDSGIKTAGLTDFDGQISSTWNVLSNSTDATTNAGSHGTYVAGVVGLALNNDVGNAGYCPKCQLMPIQVGYDTGATLSDIASGLTYAADHGARVANMSWAGTTDSSTLQNAVNYAHNKGLVIFAAAGNSNCDCKTYPAAEQNVLGVAGVSNSNTKQGDSNYGTWVQIAAPEGNLTAWPTINGAPGYAAVGGTSVASPAAAAIAGLLFSYNPNLTNTQVEQALENSAIPVNFTIAHGRVDALAALQSLGASDPQPVSPPIQTAAPHLYYELNGTTGIAPFSSIPQVGQTLVRGIGGWTGSSGISIANGKWQRCDSTGNNCGNYVALTGTYTIQSADVGSTIKLTYTVQNSVGSVPVSILTPVVGSSTSLPIPGDLNSDSHVDVLDLSILLSNFSSTNATSDINHDGTVDILDLSILLSNFGK